MILYNITLYTFIKNIISINKENKIKVMKEEDYLNFFNKKKVILLKI